MRIASSCPIDPNKLADAFSAGSVSGSDGKLPRFSSFAGAGSSGMRLSAATGQEYFDVWLEAARSMEEEIGIARMEHEYPAGWLCLRLADT